MANYRLLDKYGNELNHHNLQDKSFWCNDGEQIEHAFIRTHGSQLKLIINPEKKTNPYVPDLLDTTSGKLADLKLQSTPFFKAQSLYNIDPTYAVVFNLKDKNRYMQHYPTIDIYYWIDWRALAFEMYANRIEVQPLYGVWKIPFLVLNELLDDSSLHNYQQRLNDNKGNAKSSFVIDIRESVFTQLI